MREISKILIKAPNWLGDCVFAAPAAGKLKADHPAARISVLAKDSLAPFWELVPGVDAVIGYEKRRGWAGLRAAAATVAGLRRERYDLAVIFPRSFSSALWCFTAGIAERRGYAAEGRRLLLNRVVEPKTDYRQTPRVDYYYALVGDPGKDRPRPRLEIPEREIEEARDQLRRLVGSDRIENPVGLHPGGYYGSAKRWPVEHFSRLARRLARSGRTVLVFGGQGDRETAGKIVSGAPSGVWSLAGETGLKRLAALLKLCRVVVANDSGPLHLAAAVETAVVGLFGSTNPVATGPRGKAVRVIYRGLPCSPCLLRTCPKGLECMVSIGVEEVMAAVEELWNS